MNASIHIYMYRVWVSRFTTVVVGVSKAGEKTVGRLTLCMCDFVETERNALFMECFTNQVPSFGGNVVVFFPKDLNIYAPSSAGYSYFFSFFFFISFPCFDPQLV